jgi:hypothetical protein
MASVFRFLKDWFAPPRIKAAAGIEELATREAAALAQKASMGYCQVKAGLNYNALLRDAEFVRDLELCRWKGFAAVLADFELLVEGYLRPAAEDCREEVRTWLIELYRNRLAPGPFNEGRKRGDVALVNAFISRLTLYQSLPVRSPQDFGEDSAKQVFEALPFHESIARHDFGVILGMVRFGSVAFWGELERRVDAAAVVASLPSRSPPSHPR